MSVGLAACGKAALPPRTGAKAGLSSAAPSAGPSTHDPQADDSDGLVTKGLIAHLSEGDIELALTPRFDDFQRCYEARVHHLRALSGRIELAFRVRKDGTTRWVYPKLSTLGDRATERCILNAASSTRFRSPRGEGEAEFVFPLELGARDEGVYEAENVDSRIGRVVKRRAASVLLRCKTRPRRVHIRLTAYVAPSGRVLAAGASVDRVEAVESLDCLADTVRQWSLPRSNAGISKVAFALR